MGDLGQPTGPPELIARGVQCAIEALSGRELENARQQMANASYRVKLRPGLPLTPSHYLVNGHGGQRLNIGFVDNDTAPGVWQFLTCGVDGDGVGLCG